MIFFASRCTTSSGAAAAVFSLSFAYCDLDVNVVGFDYWNEIGRSLFLLVFLQDKKYTIQFYIADKRILLLFYFFLNKFYQFLVIFDFTIFRGYNVIHLYNSQCHIYFSTSIIIILKLIF